MKKYNETLLLMVYEEKLKMAKWFRLNNFLTLAETYEKDAIRILRKLKETENEKPDGDLEISSGGCVKHNDVMLDSGIEISPRSSNVITVRRKVYK